MESGLGLQLVDRRVGGVGGGGARLTDAGNELVERFNLLAADMDAALAARFAAAFDNRQ